MAAPQMPHIDAVWVFLSIDEDGDEGICAFKNGTNWMPMVAADEERVDHLRPVAEQLAKLGGKPIRLVRFSERQDVEVIGWRPT